MSIACDQNDPCRHASADVFIWLLQVGRQVKRLSVEGAAHHAGMETADWLAIEDGRLPEPGQLRPMAKVLDFKFEQLAVLDRMRRKA